MILPPKNRVACDVNRDWRAQLPNLERSNDHPGPARSLDRCAESREGVSLALEAFEPVHDTLDVGAGPDLESERRAANAHLDHPLEQQALGGDRIDLGQWRRVDEFLDPAAETRADWAPMLTDSKRWLVSARAVGLASANPACAALSWTPTPSAADLDA